MQANGADTAPAAGMISQYVKDLSFENPNAPGIFQRPSGAQPQIDVQFNIGANQIGDEVHEVLLKLEVRAEADGEVAFVVDLTYAGIFGLRNVPQERSEEHRSELQSLMRISYAVFCLNKIHIKKELTFLTTRKLAASTIIC